MSDSAGVVIAPRFSGVAVENIRVVLFGGELLVTVCHHEIEPVGDIVAQHQTGSDVVLVLHMVIELSVIHQMMIFSIGPGPQRTLAIGIGEEPLPCHTQVHAEIGCIEPLFVDDAGSVGELVDVGMEQKSNWNMKEFKTTGETKKAPGRFSREP